jgi:hypothetical protein
MNEEIPYAVYVKNESKDSIELIKIETNTNELPVSIEIVPHKAILVQDAAVVVNHRNYIYFESKWCFFTFCSIPFMISIIMVVGILDPQLFTTK